MIFTEKYIYIKFLNSMKSWGKSTSKIVWITDNNDNKNSKKGWGHVNKKEWKKRGL